MSIWPESTASTKVVVDRNHVSRYIAPHCPRRHCVCAGIRLQSPPRQLVDDTLHHRQLVDDSLYHHRQLVDDSLYHHRRLVDEW
jgi:hypothetical protein